MHVLWTPSWYPTAQNPLNGSFFAEQKQMLENHGMTVGVLTLNAVSAWQKSDDIRVTNRHDDVFRRSVPTIPLGLLPGDRALIRAQAKLLGEEYATAYGIPDIIHAHSVFPGILVAEALSDMWRVPFGVTEHRPSSLDRRTFSPRYRAIRRAVSKSSFNATVSTQMAEELTDYYGVLPFEAIPLPCSQEFFDAPLHQFSDDSFTFVHVSSMDANKRTRETIAAFAQVLSTHPQARLLLVGGSERLIAEHQAFATEQNIPDSAIEFTGSVPRTQIVSQMGRGDCLVLVSEFEAGGTVFSEAMALSLPLIASATAAGKFAVTTDTGFLVPIDDHAALVSAMRKMIDQTPQGRFNPHVIREHALNRSSEHAFVAAHKRMYEGALRKA